jgi:small subunit ribosomal protein S15e
MVGSVVDVYGGKYWNSVEVRADMIGHYLAEFSLTYKPIKHGKVGVGATRSSKFTSLK